MSTCRAFENPGHRIAAVRHAPAAPAAAVRRAAVLTAVELLEGRLLMAGDPSVVQAVPFSLDFSSPGAGVVDAAGQGTGFTWVQPNKNGDEYQAGLIHLDTSHAVLQLTTTGTSAAGGPFEGDNSLVNGLQTQFDATGGAFTISTRVVGPLDNLIAPTEQGGLLFGPDDDNYVKLVVGDFPNGPGLQFIDEQKPAGASTWTHAISSANSFTSIGSLSKVNTIDLELSGDPSTGTITGYYRVNGGALQALPQQVTLGGGEKAAFFSATARAGIMAMAKNDQPPVTVSFGKFAVATGTAASQLPSVLSSDPAPNATKVRRDAFISCDLRLPNSGLDGATVNSTTVYLFRASDGSRVSAVVNTTGGGDAIVLTPNTPLDANTKYTFVATNGVKDLGGASLVPFSYSFTTGTDGGQTGGSDLAFQKVSLPTTNGVPFTCVRVGPDHRLYASSEDGKILRFAINPDGTLGTPDVITTLQAANKGQRLISGFAFDPASTPTDVRLWVCHGFFALAGAPDFSGKITLMTGPNLENVQDAVINLPRAARDHLTEQPVFGPDGALYLCQGSNTAFGAPDAAWGNRPEHLLNAAILRLDTTKVTPGKPLNAKTDSGGTYNPYAKGAPLTIYATGVRNTFDLVWTRDGHLYAPNNGSAAGGNSPAFDSSDPNQVNGPRIDTGKPYAGPDVPALTNIDVAEDDYVFDVAQGGYYGHPNPARGEFVLNGGNPTAGADAAEESLYPVGTRPDPNYRGFAFDLGAHHSPDGVIEYQGAAFNGALDGALLVAEYSGGSDVVVLTRDAQGNITGAQRGITGLTDFANPVNLCEDPLTGNIYVAELGGQKLTLLKPASADAVPPAPPAGADANGSTGGVTVTWNANTEGDLAGYNVYRATAAGGPFVKINTSTLTGTSFTDPEAGVGTTTYYQVTAVDGTGNESAPSAVTSAFRPNNTAPAAPATPTPKGALAGVTLTWVRNGESDLAGYNVYRSDFPGGPFEQVNARLLASPTFTDADAPASVTSYYRITAVNTTGNESGASAVVSAFRPDAVAPAAAAGPRAKFSHGAAAITWAPNVEADLAGYNVYRSATGEGGFVRLNTDTITPLIAPTFSDATPGAKKAWYVVTAVDTSGNESPFSVAVSPAHRGSKTPGTVGGAPGLSAALAATLPPAAVGGARVKAGAVVTLTNTGTATFSGAVTLNLLASADTTLDAGDAAVTSVTKNLTLKAGQSRAVRVKVSALPNVSGDYHLLAQATAQGLAAAVAASANTVKIAPPFIDFAAAVIKTPTTATAGKKLSVLVDVKNNGNVAASGPLDVVLSLSNNAAGSNPAPLGTITKGVTIKPGGHKTIALSMALPIGTAPGNRFVVARVDPSGRFGDANTTDNVAVSAAVDVI